MHYENLPIDFLTIITVDIEFINIPNIMNSNFLRNEPSSKSEFSEVK
jgi:hypothetical protein